MAYSPNIHRIVKNNLICKKILQKMNENFYALVLEFKKMILFANITADIA